MKGVLRIAETVFATAVIIAAWDFYTRFYDVPNFLLPSPASVWSALVEAAKGQLFDHLFYTVSILTSGYLGGALLGLGIGLLLAKCPRIERWFSGPILF